MATQATQSPEGATPPRRFSFVQAWDALADLLEPVIEWLIRLRVRRAQDLLEATDEPIDAIAERSGFGTPETLRHHFRKVVGTRPSQWRMSFRGRAA